MEEVKGRSAWIFTLGNEVVEGRVINTNASYLGRRLTLLGFKVVGNISLIDDVNLIANVVKHVSLNYKPRLIVTTGGLGPTYDDRTLEAIALAFNRELILNEEALEMVKSKYRTLNLPLTEERVKMAYLPKGAVPIPNPVGTAPGSWLEIKELNLIVISLPGVPKELEAMWEGWVEKRIKKLVPKVFIAETTFTIVGIPESTAAAVLKEVYKKFSNVYVKTHPKGHEIKGPILDIYIMTSSNSPKKSREELKRVEEFLKDRLVKLGGVVKEPKK